LSESKIKLDGVTVQYGNTASRSWLWPWQSRSSVSGNGSKPPILQDISLEIEAGEFVSILGHSGCGKSTLLKVIAGFLRPTSGKVWIGGEEVTGPRSDHVFVFQEGALFPWLTVRENVGLALRAIPNHRERAEKVDEYLSLVGLEDASEHYPHMLSGGMRQRAEIVRALAAKPDVLLMDEPFSGLDYLTRLNLREEMLYLHTMMRQTTILFVTHDIDEALQLSNRLIILCEPPSQIKYCRAIQVPHPRALTCPTLNELRTQIYHHLGVHAAL
jgi:ABC-type nitrate/sulfonate/bicarbonate transport system ATPase subunit